MLLLSRVILFKFADDKVNTQLTVNANDTAVKTYKKIHVTFADVLPKLLAVCPCAKIIPCFHCMILLMPVKKVQNKEKRLACNYSSKL